MGDVQSDSEGESCWSRFWRMFSSGESASERTPLLRDHDQTDQNVVRLSKQVYESLIQDKEAFDRAQKRITLLETTVREKESTIDQLRKSVVESEKKLRENEAVEQLRRELAESEKRRAEEKERAEARLRAVEEEKQKLVQERDTVIIKRNTVQNEKIILENSVEALRKEKEKLESEFDQERERLNNEYLELQMKLIRTMDSAAEAAITASMMNIENVEPKKKKHRPSIAGKTIKQLLSPNAVTEAGDTNTWNLSKTSRWKAPENLLVKNVAGLKQLEQFLASKIEFVNKLDQGGKENVTEMIFKQSLHEFDNQLKNRISAASKGNDADCCFSYEQLLTMFEDIFREKESKAEWPTDESLPFTFVVNAFRGFIDEFTKKKEKNKLPEVKPRKKEKKEKKNSVSIEKEALKSPLPVKTSNGEIDISIVPIIEKLISQIETCGLETEGLYRVTGLASTIKELIKSVHKDASKVNFSEHPVHALTSVLKTLFRDMREPLMPYDLYRDFISISDITDDMERIRSVYLILDKLPRANYELLELLIHHLSKVAHMESSNRMNSNGLAIVFAPNIFRAPLQLSPQESLAHIPKQTICVQCLIESHLRKIRSTLVELRKLENEEDVIREKLEGLKTKQSERAQEQRTLTPDDVFGEEDKSKTEISRLSERLQVIQDRKDELNENLPTFERRDSLCSRPSSEFSTDDELDDDTESVETFPSTDDVSRIN